MQLRQVREEIFVMAFHLDFPSTGTALVLGGSGGVGAAICSALAQAGSAVALTYYGGSERAKTVCSTIAPFSVKSSAHQLDARNADAVQQTLELVAQRYGGIHTVVCAAGATLQFRSIMELDAEKWRENIDTDIHGVFNVIKAAIPHLRASTGSVVALSTMAYHRILARDAVSACPKAAVETLIRQLAAEEGCNGIRANSVALGAINAGMGSVDSESSIVADLGADAIAGIVASIRLGGRMGTADEVANAVTFLASRRASYITGQTLVVDGGATL